MIMRWRHQGVHSVATVAVSGTDSPTYKIQSVTSPPSRS
jgi:hypothetical protein